MSAIPFTEYQPKHLCLVLATFRSGAERPMRWDDREYIWRNPDGTEHDYTVDGFVQYWEPLTDEQLREVITQAELTQG